MAKNRDMGAYETHFITAPDGERLHLRIKATDRERTPILYLHGGPGSALNLAAFESCAGPFLEAAFPVAYLHQRGVLGSEGTGGARQRLRLHLGDIREAVAFLRRRFNRSRVHLVGHSWGGLTGFAYLARNEPTVARFAAICPVVNIQDIQQALYLRASRWVSAGSDPILQQELASIGPPPYPDLDDFIRLQGLGAERLGDAYRFILPIDLATDTGYGLDVSHCLSVQTRIAAALWPELYRLDLTGSLSSLNTPLLVIACGKDAAVPASSVEKIFSAYGKNHPEVDKRWRLLARSNHLPFTEPHVRERCMGHVVDFLTALGESE